MRKEGTEGGKERGNEGGGGGRLLSDSEIKPIREK